MVCSKCAMQNDDGGSYCRRCGTELEIETLVATRRKIEKKPLKSVTPVRAPYKTKDPDELTANGIGSVIVGDGFFMVAVILSATESAVSSLFWLFLLIPAFYCFGRGFADVLHARQIRKAQKHHELKGAASFASLPPAGATAAEMIKKTISGELFSVPNVTERTTRNLH